MYPRSLPLPPDSFFLFGPRSTGKTTWLRSNLTNATWFDLLLDRDFLDLSAEPDRLIDLVEATDGGWIVIDEVQKLPKLLNSVHHLLTKHPGVYKFALSGSSARKLRRLDANLLAGRVVERRFFPMTSRELGSGFQLDSALTTGLLPLVYSEPNLAEDRLTAYVHTYLQQEIRQESLVRDFPSFSRFLRVASLLNGHTINYTNVGRDAGVKRKIVEKYFSILVDTLIATWLPAWQAKATMKEVAKPKFYFFDCGVARACANRLGASLSVEEQGFLLETLILHEIRAYLSYSGKRGELSYWKSGSGNEVDLIWSHGDKHIGFEIKSSTNWKSTYERGLKTLLSRQKLHKAYGLYRGMRPLRSAGIDIFPIQMFLQRLCDGEIL